MNINEQNPIARKTLTVYLIIFIVFTILAGGVHSFDSSAIEPDPVPLTLLLRDTLLSISYGEYNVSKEYIIAALNISMEGDIAYLHIRLYNELMELVNVMQGIDLKVLNNTANRDDVRRIIYKLYRLRIDLEEYINEYIDKLYGLISDQSIKAYVINETQIAISRFLEDINGLIDELKSIYLHRIANVVYVDVNVMVPEIIMANDTFNIEVKVIGPRSLQIINTTIIIIYGDTYYITLYRQVIVNSSTSIILKPPTIEDLISRGLLVKEEVPIEIRVEAYGFRYDTIYSGLGISRSKLRYIKPLCEFYIPRNIYSNKSFTIGILAHIDYPLNLTIYLNKIDIESIIENTTLFPRNNSIEIPALDLGRGLHKLLFKIEGKGYYHNMIYAVPFRINKVQLETSISLPQIIIGPPYVIPIHVDIGKEIPFKVTVFIDNKEIISETVYGLSNKVIKVSLPYLLFTWRHHIEILVEPLNPLYESYKFSTEIYSINIPLMFLASIILGYALSTRIVSYGFSISLQSIIKYFRKRSHLVEEIAKSSISTLETKFRSFFKPAVLTSLYYRFIRVMIRHASPPRDSETLREYHHRISNVFSSSVGELIRRFIALYEKDLYSKHEVDVGEAENIVHKLERDIG